MLYITAIIKARPDSVDALSALFPPLVASTRQETGCHRYDLHRSISDPATFIMQEEWASEGSINEHSASDHFQQFVTAATPLLDGPLQIYKSEKLI
jgi:quinol monooxygenase YgiN